jgi:hypothetical protein
VTAVARAPLPLLLALAVLGGALLPREVPAGDSDVEQLVERVVQGHRTSGFRIRARLVRSVPGVEQDDVKQLLIKGRREGDGTTVLYQLLWPTPEAGAMVIERGAGRAATGWTFEPPDKVTALTPAMMAGPFFGSDLSIEDMVEGFWEWPSRKIVGDEAVGGRACRIVEFRPPPGAATGYSLVRAWIAPDIALPLRVEAFGRDGKLAKRFRADKLMRREDGRWIAANVIVEPAGSGRRTVIEGARADRDIEIPADDFSLKKVRATIRVTP